MSENPKTETLETETAETPITENENVLPGSGPSKTQDVSSLPTEERKWDNSTDESEYDERIQLHKLIIYGLIGANSGEELYTLQSIILPDPSFLSKSGLCVTQDLFHSLLPLKPIRVELYGSTVMGTAFKGSEFDFYIELHKPIRDTNQLLHLALQQLAQSAIFKHFQVLARPRIPLLKCIHTPTGYKCRINFTNEIGVHNSRIMAHLISLDRRIYDVAMMTKSWLKAHGFIGRRSITSYAALWLLFFYFQRILPPILPSIEMFQCYKPSIFVQSANVAFDYEMHMAYHTSNLQLGLELFKGFFEFYDKFDFESKIICPYLGRTLVRENFIQNFAENFPLYRHSFSIHQLESIKLAKPICIQDPFELCRTIPGKVSERYFHTFRNAIANAAKICRDSKYNFHEKDLLLALFSTNITIECHHLQNPQSHRLSFLLKPCPREMEIILQIGQQLGNDDDIGNTHRVWAESSIEFVITIFEEIFRFNITRSGLHDINKISKIFLVTGEYDVVSNRFPFRPSDSEFLVREIKFSRSIIQKLKEKVCAEVQIYADPVAFDVIHVDFRNLNTSLFDDFILNRIRDYKVAYFEKRLEDTLRILKPLTSDVTYGT